MGLNIRWLICIKFLRPNGFISVGSESYLSISSKNADQKVDQNGCVTSIGKFENFIFFSPHVFVALLAIRFSFILLFRQIHGFMSCII
jgi:hypothetical protein